MIRLLAPRYALAATAATVLLALQAAPVLAQTSTDPHRMHARHSQGRHHGGMQKSLPEVTLEAEAATEVQQDTVRITLAAEVSDADQATVSTNLRARMKTAMANALAQAGPVKVSSGNYRVWPMNDKDGRISNWRGRAEIYLESRDFDAASALTASLDADLAIASLTFFVSAQERARHEEQLVASAASSFRERARAIAQALGYSDYRLHKLNVSGSGRTFVMAPRAAMMMDASQAANQLDLESGTETITVTVQGSVKLLGAQAE